jgi:tRNA U34 5-methylaminomethyl-2-thiouridine-forming methyltransferase MnmC
VSAKSQYTIVELQSGARTVRSLLEAETFHPVIGPSAEAEALYVKQLRLPERMRASTGEFVIWDVGLGAGANALTAIKLIGDQLEMPKSLRLISFDLTTDALAFALSHAAQLDFVSGYEAPVADLLNEEFAQFQRRNLTVTWQLCRGDFPALLNSGSAGRGVQSHAPGSSRGSAGRPGQGMDIPPPHAILFDPHSPAKNPAMWTVQLFKNLFGALDPQRPCALANYTRATLARTAMLLGGFSVGVGHATGFKEETTVAANSLELIAEPLNQRWLERARRSHSAEPLVEPVYQCAPLAANTWEKLRAHPQFNHGFHR